MDGDSGRHRIVELDVLRTSGAHSLASVAEDLDRQQGLAIITEGLLGYLPTAEVKGIWRRFAATLAGFASGRYLSDVHLSSLQTIETRAFRALLAAFVRGRVYLHFRDPAAVVDELHAAGFAGAEVRPAFALAGMTARPGTRLAYVLEAST
jgi:O-methyltransferase involved in polyketide biosynthesis